MDASLQADGVGEKSERGGEENEREIDLQEDALPKQDAFSIAEQKQEC